MSGSEVHITRSAAADALPPAGDMADATAIAAGGALAARMRARMDAAFADQKKNKTKQFPVPGKEWGGDLVIVARKITKEDGDDALKSNAHTIAIATVEILLRSDVGGDLEQVPGAWRGIADIMGYPDKDTTDIVRQVLDDGNFLAEGSFADELVAWMMNRQTLVEQALGE